MSASSGSVISPRSTVAASPRLFATNSARLRLSSRMTTSSTSVDTSWRARRAPTAPSPMMPMRVMSVPARGRTARASHRTGAAFHRRPAERRAAATRPAIPMATRARRIIFIVGLAGIEPATSPLSGVRSNRLSYSPGAGSSPYRTASERGNRVSRRGRVEVVGRTGRLEFDHGEADASDHPGDQVEQHARHHREHRTGGEEDQTGRPASPGRSGRR